MKYPLLIISHVETDIKDHLVVLTFYPTSSACIKPRAYESLDASFVQHFEPGLELAEVVSEKGKRRLKLLLREPSFTDDERRTLGTMYYGLLFGHNPGNDEEKKSIANSLYHTICDLYRADTSTEDAWSSACTAAVSTIQRLIERAHA